MDFHVVHFNGSVQLQQTFLRANSLDRKRSFAEAACYVEYHRDLFGGFFAEEFAAFGFLDCDFYIV